MFSQIDDVYISETDIKKRLCPDMENIKNQLRVKNSYMNKEERISFSIEAVLCDQEGDDCALTGSKIDLLNDIYFTTYILEEHIEFGDNSNIGMRPISANDK